MSYWTKCNWCGCVLHGVDYAELPVAIKRRRATKLDRLWAEEVRPTLHFCVETNQGHDRMGIETTESEDSCLERAVASLTRTTITAPDMGMEWRLVPIGAIVLGTPQRQQKADDALAAIIEQLPAHCRGVLPRAGITTLAQIEEMTDDQLLAIKGLGPHVLAILRAAQRTKETS